MANSATFDRSSVSFSLKETTKGYFQFVLGDSGKYKLDDVDAVLAALAKNPDEKFNHYQLWLDWNDNPVFKEPVQFGAVMKFVKAKGTTAELVMTRRPFPQVKLKLSRGEGRKGSSSSKLREL